MLLRADLDDDSEAEYVLILSRIVDYMSGYPFHRDGEEWRRRRLSTSHPGQRESAAASDLLRDPIGTADPRFRDLTIGERVFRVTP